MDAKFILTPVLWKYLYHYARKHQALGNGFGYGLVDPRNPSERGAQRYPRAITKTVPRFWSIAAGIARWASNTSTIRKISFVVRVG
ncbi:DNA-cytosine methyltransferase [Raoultella planticola]|uniref:DNA-cytosine methyltransferase n=1 Tax=Raoultella planticola TaxID=575 RepID=A0A485AD96_RAOPL|nr:DNA-cytosine methyltransferase [Raoultella planticola]